MEIGVRQLLTHSVDQITTEINRTENLEDRATQFNNTINKINKLMTIVDFGIAISLGFFLVGAFASTPLISMGISIGIIVPAIEIAGSLNRKKVILFKEGIKNNGKSFKRALDNDRKVGFNDLSASLKGLTASFKGLTASLNDLEASVIKLYVVCGMCFLILKIGKT